MMTQKEAEILTIADFVTHTHARALSRMSHAESGGRRDDLTGGTGSLTPETPFAMFIGVFIHRCAVKFKV